MTATEPYAILRVLAEGPVVFRFEFRGGLHKVAKPKLTTKDAPVCRDALQPMALAALVARRVERSDSHQPPGYTETYSITALGRLEAGLVPARMPQRHRGTRPAPADIEMENDDAR